MSFSASSFHAPEQEIESNDSSEFVISNWDQLDIPEELLRSIHAYGFETPSPIQKRAILPIIQKKDIIAQAQSGTGKTATFSIGALSRVNLKENATQILMLAPTRELASQILKVVVGLSRQMTALKTQLIVGGNTIDEDVASLRKSTPHIVVGCPGRVYDMIKRSHISVKECITCGGVEYR